MALLACTFMHHTSKQVSHVATWMSSCCGAVWFFPSNLAHTLVGVEEGCEYIAGCAFLVGRQGNGIPCSNAVRDAAAPSSA